MGLDPANAGQSVSAPGQRPCRRRQQEGGQHGWGLSIGFLLFGPPGPVHVLSGAGQRCRPLIELLHSGFAGTGKT